MEFLPIGSVVLLKEATKKLMIIGYFPADESTKKEVYDYVGCPYPEGVVGNKQFLLFNHSEIKEIFHKGYENKEGKEITEKLIEIKNNM